jgi:hypothetical protein
MKSSGLGKLEDDGVDSVVGKGKEKDKIKSSVMDMSSWKHL